MTRNVKRWRDGKMVCRWMAVGMVVAQRQFRRVNGYRDALTGGAEAACASGMSVQQANASGECVGEEAVTEVPPRSGHPHLHVSTVGQATRDLDPEGYSIPAQREACLRKAKALSAEVVDEFVDRGESARSDKRPALQNMLSRVRETQDIDYLIVHKVDGLARNRADDVVIELALREAGTQLVSVTENIDQTPSGALLHGIMASIAEFYSSNLAHEIIKGTEQKVKKGGTPGLAPIGYLNVRKLVDGHEVRTVEVDHERAPLIQWAFEAYATGEYGLDGPLKALTEKGLVTRPTKRSPAQPLFKSNLAQILRNEYYYGIVSYRAQYGGKHKPLSDAETFHQVQAVLAAHDATGERERKHQHYLKGTVYCDRCESRLCLTLAKGRRVGGEWLYFFYNVRHKGNGCPQPYVLAETVEQAIADHYATVQLTPERMADLRDHLLTELSKVQAGNARTLKRQQSRLPKLRAERDKLLRAYLGGAIDMEVLKREQTRINQGSPEASSCSNPHGLSSRTLRRSWSRRCS